MLKQILQVLLFIFCIFTAIKVYAGITNTKHNLSVTGPGTIKATAETQICVFCHTPHGARDQAYGPLWNHSLGGVKNYIVSDPIAGGTQLSSPVTTPEGERVDGASKLCLSCHDGTVAIGALYNYPGPGWGTGPVAGLGITMPTTSPAYVGTVLTNDHIVSIAYNGNSVDTLVYDKLQQFNNPDGPLAQRIKPVDNPSWTAPSNKIRLRPTGATYKGAGGYQGRGVQCSTCHDPHGTPCSSPGVGKCESLSSTYTKFVVVDYTNATNLCGFCHCSYATDAECGW